MVDDDAIEMARLKQRQRRGGIGGFSHRQIEFRIAKQPHDDFARGRIAMNQKDVYQPGVSLHRLPGDQTLHGRKRPAHRRMPPRFVVVALQQYVRIRDDLQTGFA